MHDQAEKLRLLKSKVEKGFKEPEVITITSGKGGVGKSNTSVNLALALGELGKKVLLVDVDLGLGNTDLLLGVYPKYNLFDYFKNNIQLSELIFPVNENVDLLAGGSALSDEEMLEKINPNTLRADLQTLMGYDYILFDTGAGINRNVTYFALSADQVILVTTPEPTAITDAYALLKTLYGKKHNIKINILVNRAADFAEGEYIANKLIKVAYNFLKSTPNFLGFITDDKHVQQAVKLQKPYITLYHQCTASKDVKRVANKILGKQEYKERKGLFNIFRLFK
ncbi:MinD/ParA family protein [Anaerobranca gottschalkii]|uniref:Flagellar biosynthesis protein FlhG n=1 Tax=Anaerobranca gottschalkii DSM 13577 TaxID=1120990 RepID=A0A1H9ZCE7_9FIRM|nr:MinD/ParA family protein [Anaerobranca gottschalkii]SES79237.1 flagellar biosynthesis protein FlhG [Anaerobranca gottschalkii DSM 13577]